jgi:tocopherol O-methyltransferase
MESSEKCTSDYYQNIWKRYNDKVNYKKSNNILGFHYGFFEKGVINPNKASLNMNDFLGRLLGLDKTKSIEILDAGCGVGGTSTYLALKYPNSRFTGITIAPIEIELANKFSKEKNVNNVNFILGNYTNTGLPDNHFDCAFALESECYAQNKKNFLHEMNRILKPGGKLIIIDVFLKDKTFNSFRKKFYQYYCIKRGKINFPNIKIFKSYLEEEGFKDIKIKNISKNIIPNFLILFFSHNRDFPNVIFLDAIVGLCNMSEYNVITAIKK